jgi:hypothetical protein
MLALCFWNFVGTSIDVVLAHELEKEKDCGTIFFYHKLQGFVNVFKVIIGI